MKTKVVYFLLGALVASIGYGVGTLQHPLNAADQIMEVEYIRVKQGILIGEKDAEIKTAIAPGAIGISKGDKIKGVFSINEKGVPLIVAEVADKKAYMGISNDGKPIIYLVDGVSKKLITAGN